MMSVSLNLNAAVTVTYNMWKAERKDG